MNQDTSAEICPGQLTRVMLNGVLRRVRVVNVTPRYVYFRYYKRGVGYIEGKVRSEVLRADIASEAKLLVICQLA